jgi:hypothetical protein
MKDISVGKDVTTIFQGFCMVVKEHKNVIVKRNLGHLLGFGKRVS